MFNWLGQAAIALSIGCVCAGTVSAQAYPSKAVRIVVPFAAGGGTDVIARYLAAGLTESLKHQVIVDNRAGANAIVGTEHVVRAGADGYTLLFVSSPHMVNPSIYAKLPYDTLRDFEPVSQLTAAPYMMAVHPSLPVKTFRELVTFAKARPGELNHASGGNGTGPHLAMELLMQQTGMKLVHITYKGGGPAMIDFIAGHTQVYMSNIVTILPQVKAGKARALATSGEKRSNVSPDVPTISESGIALYSEGAFHGVVAPAGVPKPVIERLHAEIVKAMKSDEVLSRLTAEGAEVVASSPQEFTAKIRGDVAKWAKVIKAAGIKPD
jgi:tripartite-type tricarboxylate transporter receptor subunit TctC